MGFPGEVGGRSPLGRETQVELHSPDRRIGTTIFLDRLNVNRTQDKQDTGHGMGSTRPVKRLRAAQPIYTPTTGNDWSITNFANFRMLAFDPNGRRLAVASLAIPWTIDHARSANRRASPAGNRPSP
jgi:hypothetical protein